MHQDADWRRPHADVHLAQLLLADLGGRVGQRIRRRLRLRERDDVADAVRAGHVHDQAIETERDATMRRRAELQRVEQEAELELRFFGADAQQFEHRRLHVLAVDTHRTTGDLAAVEHEVVGLRKRAIGLAP